jgi:hypothetical protein
LLSVAGKREIVKSLGTSDLKEALAKRREALDDTPAVMDTFTKDIVTFGDLSDEGFAFAQSKLGMNEQAVRSIYSEMQEVGGSVLSDFLEVGDGLGADRIDFLVDRAEYGTRQEQEIVRSLWVKAATGKLTREAAAKAFDKLYQPYE